MTTPIDRVRGGHSVEIRVEGEPVTMSDEILARALVGWLDQFAAQGVFTTDERLIVTSWNRWLERHTGRMAAQVVGRPLLAIYPELAEQGLDERYQEALAGQVHLASHLLHRHVLPMQTRVGDDLAAPMPQRAQISPLSAGGRVVGTITVIDDVSERVAAESALRKQIEAQEAARTAAEQALRLKDEFLAVLSHEIRTPLSAVLGWARILTERELEPQLQTRALNSIYRNATIQARMIDDLLDTARMLAGKLQLQRQVVDLIAMTFNAIDVLVPVLEARRIDLRTSLDPTVARVLGDPDRLQQIIWNLLSNAAKFTEPGGRIDVRLEQLSHEARITVADTGKGIDPAFLPHVFERFRQQEASSSGHEGGLGLGLALVRELVELHGGTVRAESEGVGKGATFVVGLPTVATPERQQQPHTPGNTSKTAGAAVLSGVRVLVVADDGDARELLMAILSDAGADVTALASSDEALRCLRGSTDESRPHVVVSDCGTTRGDGDHLIREVRHLWSERRIEVPAVAVTGDSALEERARTLSAGYRTHVSKPVDPAALIAAVTAAVSRADA